MARARADIYMQFIKHETKSPLLTSAKGVTIEVKFRRVPIKYLPLLLHRHLTGQ